MYEDDICPNKMETVVLEIYLLDETKASRYIQIESSTYPEQ